MAPQYRACEELLTSLGHGDNPSDLLEDKVNPGWKGDVTAEERGALHTVTRAEAMATVIYVFHCRFLRAISERFKYSHDLSNGLDAAPDSHSDCTCGYALWNSTENNLFRIFILHSLCRILQRRLWRVSFSWIWRRVVRCVSTDVSEEHNASIFRV
jgi:hypothetical protein